MGSIFKGIGKGILYIFIFPIYLIGLVVFAIYGIFLFIFMCFRNIILFFRGMKIDYDLPEDKEAQRRMSAVADPYEKLADEAEAREAAAKEAAKPQVVVIEPPKVVIDDSLPKIDHTEAPQITTIVEEEISTPKKTKDNKDSDKDEILPLGDDENSHIFKEDDD